MDESQVMGTCRRCPIGQFSSKVGAACSKCPLGQTNNDARDGCQCMPDFYNKTLGVKCFKMEYTSPAAMSDGCQSCLELECIDSCEGMVTVAKGWSLVPQPDNSTAVFACMDPGACQGGSAAMANNQSDCAVGHRGTLCGVCESGWELNGDGSCSSCKPWTTSSIVILVVIFILVVAVALRVKSWYDDDD